MAQKVIVTLTCDMPHDGEAEPDRVIRYSIDGANYEMDACTKHGEQFEKDMGAYTAYARKVTGRTPRRAPAAPAGQAGRAYAPRTAAARQERAEIRDWAGARHEQTGDTKYQCSERGRLSRAVAALYYEETGATPR